ncbi:type IX secretion system PorP/SprF family membrane protein [Catalinimonas alkaloidigena]|uniref:PorP/SprF family type IX secretion system membrane protein n=1 Tax=Catalinimonas alkaloidigena TaxID=1075417 RepID=UPI00240593B4|nr:type IX secretion system membrane protein PorP/SprF [Catalinimonas alkaloidigena]MDF9797607.1 type IX secretion system PorP/SprF family membrane protein [Catalinimonas alkaloidigena]
MLKFYTHRYLIILIIGIFVLLQHSLIAQQRPIFSQYMFNGLVLNPAYAGNQPQLSVSLLHRDQWVNVDGAPKTSSFIAHSALKNRPVGLGLLVSRDKIGVHDDYSIYGSYAYKLNIGVGTLSLGLQAGFNYMVSDFTKLSTFNPDDPLFYGTVTRFSPNFGTGAFFSNKTSYAGISIPYLINNKVYDKEDVISEAREARYYFVTGGHVFHVSPGLKIKPSGLIRVQEGQPIGVDINTNVFLQEILNVGASYRSGDSIILLFEMLLNKNLSVGYAYDHTLSRIRNYTDGTHEFMLTFRRPLGKGPCHAYF